MPERKLIRIDEVKCGNCKNMKRRNRHRCYRDTKQRDVVGRDSIGCGNFKNVHEKEEKQCKESQG